MEKNKNDKVKLGIVKTENIKKRYYRKHVDFFRLLQKVKLWPSRKGVLHGIKSIEIKGNIAEIETHCHEIFIVTNAKTSRAARWLRNKWYTKACSKCKVPEWKIQKYSSTVFDQHTGSNLTQEKK